MKKVNHMYFKSKESREMYFHKRPTVYGFWMHSYHGQGPTGLHQTMFNQSVEQFSTEEQKKHWLPKALNLDILGCYAQTELGHGSNVASLETTATLDKKTDEFVIHSPTITSTKFWPGDMGRYCSHALVMARLIIDDNDYGVAPFLVQIRSLKDHKWQKGIKCGDIGPKFGYHGKDNGWLTFDHVRIPRDNMLQKFISVAKDGEVGIQGDVRVLYSTMIMIRTIIIANSKMTLAPALTIALRYSAVRRQFRNISG